MTEPTKHPERLPALTEYVLLLRDRMNLQTWRLEVKEEDNDEVYARVMPWHTYRMGADLFVAPEFWTLTPPEQREGLVHELIHLIHRDMTDVIRVGKWANLVGQATYDLVWGQHNVEEERATELLSRLVAPSMPLPPEWPE